MDKRTDLLVIGAGLSGLMAASKAAEQGKQVLLVTKGLGALGLSSGCIDLWGYRVEQPDQICPNPLAEIKKVIKNNSEHPYAKVMDVLEESIDYFTDLCADRGIPYYHNEEENWLLPTALGTVRPTFLVPASMGVKPLSEVRSLLVVGFKGLKDFYPEVLITNLRSNGRLRSDCQLNTALIDLGAQDLLPNTLAHRLEKQEVLAQVVSQLKPLVQVDTMVLFPPVLGEYFNSQMAVQLSEALGGNVYEVANIPPALPGQRLQQALLNHIKGLGVEVIMNCTVKSADVDNGKCVAVTAMGSGKKYKIIAETVVLATGSFLGGGLEAVPGKVRETIFNLPVKVSAKWTSSEFLNLEGHDFNKFGLLVNDQLQPVDSENNVLINNLMVTGANLANCNYAVEKCGNGVALTTGYKAGKLAGRG
jgi:glycerol-3-phosphate dehydrogenase subunit B